MKRLVVSFSLLVACNNPSPPKEAPHDAKTADAAAPVANSASSSPTSSSPTVAAPGACTADADCRTWSSYCKDAPCGCRVLSKSEAEPACNSGKVTCFADPCMRKKAACQEGRCALILADATAK